MLIGYNYRLAAPVYRMWKFVNIQSNSFLAFCEVGNKSNIKIIKLLLSHLLHHYSTNNHISETCTFS